MKYVIKKLKNCNLITIKNDNDFEISLCDVGASVYYVKVNKDYLTYHPDKINDFLTSKAYHGKILGRTAGRIKDGKYTINKVKYQLDLNENGVTCIHGGKDNFSYKKFKYKVIDKKDFIQVIFTYKSKDNDSKFVGECDVKFTYTIFKDVNIFILNLEGVSNKDTLMNLSTHIYWRLLGKDILNHKLYVDSDYHIANNLITQVNEKVIKNNSSFNFKKMKEINKDIAKVIKLEKVSNGYDHAFILNDSDKAKIVLSNGKYTLNVDTDYKACNIYTNCNPTTLNMKGYGKDSLYKGIAIEPQLPFTSYKDIILKKNKKYNKFISFEIKEN